MITPKSCNETQNTILTQEGEILSFTLSFLGVQLLFLMHVGMSTQDKNPEFFSRTQYFTKFWMIWQNLSQMPILSDNGHWSDHWVCQWLRGLINGPLIRPPGFSLAVDQTTRFFNGPLIRPPGFSIAVDQTTKVCVGGHWSDRCVIIPMAIDQTNSSVSQWPRSDLPIFPMLILETTRVLLMTIGLLVANWTDHWVLTPNGPLIRLLGLLSIAIDETTGSFQWLLIRLFGSSQWLPGSSPRAAI